jgi:tetratricopeptide (TPR) repeat protein
MSTEIDKLLESVGEKIEAKEYEHAVKMLDDFASRQGFNAEILRQRGHVNALCKNFNAAVVDLSRAIDLNEMEPDYFYTRGRYLVRLANYREAVKDFSRVLELCDYYKSDYYRVPAHFFRADAYLKLGQFESALEDCKYIPDDFQTWTDQLRSKRDILGEIGSQSDR